MTEEALFEDNKKLWDQRVPIHVASPFYGVEQFKWGSEVLHDFEIEEVGDVRGLSLVHLQCHFGMDSLGWARHGAAVTGLDISTRGVEAAQALADEMGIDARFVTANVYDAVSALGETYDIVYTGRGALNWLPDITRWARVVNSLLKPGGFLYLSEFHPIAEAMADESVTMEYDYFGRAEGYPSDSSGETYTETGERTEHTRSIEWIHPTSAVLTSLLDVGLVLGSFREYDFSAFGRFPFLECENDGIRRVYRMPEDRPNLPLMYSIMAHKPE